MSALYFGFRGEGNRSEYEFVQIVVERQLQALLPGVEVRAVAQRQLARGPTLIPKLLSSGHELIVMHIDADGRDTRQAMHEHYHRYVDSLDSSHRREAFRLVPIVPIRMTEAWLFVDFEAFRQATGTKKTADTLNFPRRPSDVERMANPKAAFDQAVLDSIPYHRHNFDPQELFERIAVQVDLRRLQQVPAYQDFMTRLQNALKHPSLSHLHG